MPTAVSNVKIDEALREEFHHYAEVHNENLGVATEELLLITLIAVEEAGVFAEDIDSQHTEESVVGALTPRKIRALRRLLKEKK